MMRIPGRLQKWVVAGLLVLAGCTPVKQLANTMTSKEAPPPSAKEEVKAPEGEKPPPPTEPAPRQTPPLPLPPPAPQGYRMTGDEPMVAERLALYQQKKVEWEEAERRRVNLGPVPTWPDAWSDCLKDIELALAGYLSLQAAKEPGQNPWQTVGQDIHYLTNNCDQVLATVTLKLDEAQSPSAELPPGSTDQLRQFYLAGQYQATVAAYEKLVPLQTGTTIMPREAKTCYGRALVKLGRFQEAAVVLTELLRGGGAPTDVAELEVRTLAGDVLMAVGQVEEARQVYAGLAKTLAPAVSHQEWAAANAQALAEQVKEEELGLYQELLQAYLQFDGQRAPQPIIDLVAKLQGRKTTGPLLELARIVLARATVQFQSWMKSQLAEIRDLLDTHDLVLARELLEQVTIVAPPEMKPSIAQLHSEIAQAESTQATQNTSGEQGTPEPWAQSMQFFEQQRYDEAIAGFQRLVDGEHGPEAKAKIAEATELAATAMRRQAAALYAKSRKVFDPEEKRQTLQSSRTLLMQLIEKYPGASVADKARQNLKVLNGELGQSETNSPPSPPPSAGKSITAP